uniref:Peroxisome proliferator-activated receptor gamma, coactivator-related 1 n=1 Tax=Iconisemion striatum TaxID=60296 RepID=A0A1A7WIE0_9TELE
MAARFSGEDGHLNTGKSEFLLSTANELVLHRSHQDGVDFNSLACVDHSILAIFEDSGVSSESKNNMEEDSETLLSALTEMLDRVEEDGDGTFSPFDVLPTTKLLSQSLNRDEELLPSQILRPKPETKTERKKEKTLEARVEVFTSTSLISLVNLMHPYCLKLQVEDKPGSRQSLFSQEQVWRYERPTEENDEEINVVSDDEEPVKRTKEDVKGDQRRRLKGVLLNGNSPRAASSRDRKWVSFGPVHVVSLDQSEEERFGEGSLSGGRGTEPEPVKSTIAPKNPETLEFSSSERNDEKMNDQQGEKKRKTRVKSLSLQEYRKLRQNRRPQVEKQGDHITRWPSVTEPPKELTPILCFHGPDHHKPSVHRDCPPHLPNPIPSHQSHTSFKGTESKMISPTSPLPEVTTNPNLAKNGPVKKTLISTDPPNPVLLPLQVPHPPPNPSPESRSGTVILPSSRNPQTQAAPPEPKPHLWSPDKDDAALPQEVKAGSTETPPDGSSASPVQTSDSSLRETKGDELLLPKNPVKPRKCRTSSLGWSPPPVELKEEAQREPSSPQTDLREPRAAVASGIEAPDLTSLLEQFEETQAKEHNALSPGSSPAHQQADVPGEPNNPGGPDRTSGSPLKSPAASSDSTEPVNIPEPLRTEIVQSSERDQPTRRKNPPSKSIQIIDPRPLPPKKIHTESPPHHVFSYLCFDHDYCGSADLPPGSQSSSLRETSQPSTEQLETRDSAPAAGGQKCVPTVLLQDSEPPWTAPEALQLSEGVGVNHIQFLPTPPPSPPVRGRAKRRYRRRSPHSDSSSRSSSSSSSCSSCACCSPKRRRIHRRRSESGSCSSSPSSCVSRSPPPRCSLSFSRSAYSRSRSRSWSRSRSPSPATRRRRWREARSNSRESRRPQKEQEVRIQKLKAIDERRVVYVGRIRRTMTHNELRERFSHFGEVECVSLHFRERGDHYAFVTFYNMKDAFAAIDNGGKLRKSDELPFDICFGGRRQFCNSNYADLDANREAEPAPPTSRFEDLDFDSLLKQAQRGLKR